jgi:hypothetical protein
MREEMNEEIQDQEVEWFIKDGISRAVEADHGRLDRIESNVMEALRNRPQPQRRGLFSWLRMPSLPTLRPAMGFGMAAASFVFGFFVAFLIANSNGPSGTDTLFVMAYPEATEVALAGDFTKWEAVELKRGSGGTWFIEMKLEPGRHEYVFIVDGDRKVIDPRADEYVKSYEYTNSVIFI